MKLLKIAAIIGLTALSLNVNAYECYAQSNYAWGRAFAVYEGDAAQRALYECAIRTPSYDTCYIQYCERSRGTEKAEEAKEGAVLSKKEKESKPTIKNEEKDSMMKGTAKE